VQTAEGSAEWLHARVRRELGIEPTQGRRYSWGYPACPDQSEHEKIFRLLGASDIGLRLSSGWALEPEQSTLAIIAHHPQAVYFGMKSGFLAKGAPPPDEVIAGSPRDPTRGADASALAADELALIVEDEGEATLVAGEGG
jgi:5-methyltetrahydrofolate--homocysteine methyltransferase